MKINISQFYWHPFLVAVFPVLFLFAHNYAYVPIEDVVLPLLATLLLTIILFALFGLVFRNLAKAAILTSATLFLFFTYGAIYSFLQQAPVNFLRKHSVLILADLILLVPVVIFLVKLNGKPYRITKIINVFALLLVALPVGQIVTGLLKGHFTTDISTSSLADSEWKTTLTADQRPDIFYIVLDGYGRQDVLQKYYGLDNQPFLDSLRQEGFQVSEKSTSNYCRTVASVASTLNLDYIQNLAPRFPDFCFTDLEELIEGAALLKFLVKQNYYLYGFASGYGHTELTRHVNLIKPYKTLPPFYYMVLNKTPYILIEENGFLNEKYSKIRKLFLKDPEPYFVYRDTHRDMILYSLNHLQDFAGRPQPSFIFADVFVGHPPFIFDRQGNYIPNADTNPLADGDQFSEGLDSRREKYIAGNREQTLYLNKKILAAVRNIKKRITRPTVIILQGDHGPGAHFSHISLAKSNIEERFSNLNAVYYSDREPAMPADVSAVNTFRYILNDYFGTSFGILPNRQFYSPAMGPCNFTEVTNQYSKLMHQ